MDNLRQHHRYPHSVRVLVESDGSQAPTPQLVWTEDISVGGLFVCLDSPLAPGAPVSLDLYLPTGQKEKLKATVVHTRDQGDAGGAKQGVGLQFVGLSDEQSASISSYLETLPKVASEDNDLLRGTTTWDLAYEVARPFLEAYARGDIYGALDLSPSAQAWQIKERVKELSQLLSYMPTRNSLGAVQVMTAAQILKYQATFWADPESRVRYDFAHGFVRAEDRIEAAKSSEAGLESLRRIWAEVFPEHVQEAASHEGYARTFASNSLYGEALRALSQALELDPFHDEYLALQMEWRFKLECEP